MGIYKNKLIDQRNNTIELLQDDEYLIVEIPHQLPARTWHGSRQHIINCAQNHDSHHYQVIDQGAALDCYGDEIPGELQTILDRDGVAVEIDVGHGIETVSLEYAGSEFESACEYIAHDLSRCHFFKNSGLDQFLLAQKYETYRKPVMKRYGTDVYFQVINWINEQ